MNLFEEIQAFLEKSEKPLIVVLGPTASGKTALSVKIAKSFSGEIISTDSRQIYKGMSIGTDAVSSDEQEGIPHHMLSVVEPDQMLSAADYSDRARQIIEEIYKREHLPILAGGTGLYISSIIESYDIPRIAPNPELRKKLELEAAEKGAQFLHQKLKKIDPEAADSIHPNNIRYVIRAIEINLEGGRNKKAEIQKSPYDILMIGIKWPREELYKRIGMRVDRQIERGLLEEVKGLLAKGYEESLPAMSSLGVKEIIPYLKGEMELTECLEILKQNTRRYAKRQMTWFRRYDNVKWLSPEQLEKYLNS